MATDRVGIEIELIGYQEAMNQMRNLERSAKGLKGIKIRMDAEKRLKTLKQNAAALRAEAERLKAEMSGVAKGSTEWNQMNDRLRQVRREMSQTAAEAQRMNHILRNTTSVGQIFKKNTSAVAHLGSAMQSAGNAMQRFLAPWRLLTGGALLGAGFSAINKVTEGLSAGFNRYDIMKQYPRMMKQFETSNYSATDSINDLDKAVRGMPTGLDEIVNMSQQFTMTMGDMEKGTKLAIAANNSFLASMTDESKRYQGMSQLRDVIGGKDMTAKEWQSLAQSMMPAIRMMGEELGKSGKELDEWVASVQQGKISNEEFLDAMVKAGTKTGKVAKMAELSKDTWAAFSANITNAFSRMGEGIIKTMDDVVAIATNGKYKQLNRLLADNVAPGIDKVAKSAQKWIKANPDKIIDFFNALKGVNWASIGQGFIKGLGTMANLIQGAAKMLEGKDLSLIGNIFSKMLLLAPMLTIGGGLLKGFRHPIGGGLTGLKLLFDTITSLNLAKASTNVGKMGKFIKQFAKVKKEADSISKGGKIAKGAGAIGKGAFKSLGAGMGYTALGVFGLGTIVTEIIGFATLNTALISKGVDNLKAITSGIPEVIQNVKAIGKYKFGAGDKKNLGEAVGAMTTIYDMLYGEDGGQKTRAANKAGTSNYAFDKQGFKDIKAGKLKKSFDAIKNMNDLFTSIGDVLDTIPQLIEKRSGVNFTTFSNIFGGGKGVFATLAGIVREVDTYLNKDDLDISGVSGQMDSLKNIFTSLGEVGKLIPSLTKTLSKSVGTQMGRGATPMSMLKNMLTGKGGLFATIGSIYDSIQNDMLGGEYGKKGNLKDIGSFDEAMTQIKSTFTTLSQLVNIFPKLQASLGAIQNNGSGRGSILGTVKQQLSQMMDGISEIITKINGIGDTGDIEAKTQAVFNAVTKVKQIATKLSSLGESLSGGEGGAFAGIQGIKTMLTQLGNALNVEAVGQITVQVQAFTDTINQMFTDLNTAFSNVEVEVHINGKVTGVNELVAEIRAAHNRITAAVRAIPNSYYRHVYIHIQRHVDLTGDDPSAVDVNGHYRGGFIRPNGHAIYRSKGGAIPVLMKSKGTDTVPAMLTPGEYVQSKKAVDFFGVKFMQRLNHLDVKGAMRELSARVGANSVMARGMTVYNNITNNNQTVNQNVNTNNPNFAFKRSRYVAAL